MSGYTSISSTQPFTDSAEVRRQAGVTLPIPQQGEAPQPPGEQPQLIPTTLASHNSPLEELAGAFADASLATLPDARLALAWPASNAPDGPNSVIVPLTKDIAGWNTVGVVQRTQDVDFVIDIPFWSQNNFTLELQRRQLKCRLYYDPVSDDCLLVNESSGGIHLTPVPPTGNDRPILARDDRYVVSPGVWRISIAEGTAARQHLLDFCVLRRQFVVDIAEAPPTTSWSARRSAPDDDEASGKRRRVDGDVSEILVAPAAVDQQDPPGPGAIATSTPPSPVLRQIRKPGITLLDLQDGEEAIVRTIHSAAGTVTAPISTPGLESYRLRRVGAIAINRASSVFASQHSELSEPVVAKVIRYEGMSSNNLTKCVRRWRMETEMLERLHHRNIVSLRAVDGRMFAVYLELLPSSLNRGTESPFQPSDALTILRDLSSALTYLHTEQHLAHNDIKPANITYSRRRGAVLIDFEMATPATGDGKLPGGSHCYIPPEFLKNPANRGASGDMWALGITLLYVLKKFPLPDKTVKVWPIFEAFDKTNTARGQMVAWLNSVAVHKERLDRTDLVEGLVYRMLETEPASRIRADQVLAALENET
ncbi:kinase-like domain-containing protein [Dichotomopilus funicola]|uniref:Kinase-like domain-containing protein n=1 Tax=Dichotomopilus funicola TaxID=1934379 RepID=A0AAN6UXW0_9PEZI|nr:kinase-like domain-containing protein [Dichotomopilus funicola]